MLESWDRLDDVDARRDALHQNPRLSDGRRDLSPGSQKAKRYAERHAAGRNKLTVRAAYIETWDVAGTRIIISGIPFQLNRTKAIERIAEHGARWSH
jgi:hypothetical protein